MSICVDERFLVAVAVALGETIEFVRHRGFHLDIPPDDDDPRLTHSAARQPSCDLDDTVDLAAYGLDWDADDDCRIPRRLRAGTRRRGRRAA